MKPPHAVFEKSARYKKKATKERAQIPLHAHHTLLRSASKIFDFEMDVPRVNARVPSTAELELRFLNVQKSFWAAWVYNKSLALDVSVEPKELSYSEELLRLSFMDLERIKSVMRDSGVPIPAVPCTVTSLFLKQEEVQHKSSEEKNEDEDSVVPVDPEVYEELERRWDALDSAYFIAWVQQHMRIEQNKHNPVFDAEKTSSYVDMLRVGPKLDAVETELFMMGWHRPPERMVNTLFGTHAV